jgi:hypothetical protein
MMLPRDFETNRPNPHPSTGPITPAGKQIVSGNALKHGLAAKTHACLPGENEAFEKHCQGYLEAMLPVGKPEQDLVRNIAENYWRLKRAHAMENALFEQVVLEDSGGLDPASAQAQAWVDATKGLQRIALYAGRIQRAIDKSTAELKAIQQERKTAYAQAHQEAVLLTQLAAAKGETFDPASHFPVGAYFGHFVYSAPAIAAAISRAARLEEAKMRFMPGGVPATNPRSTASAA